jgi:hypothetical protein
VVAQLLSLVFVFRIQMSSTDLPLCSLFYEVASHIDNSNVRSNLHEALAQGALSGLVSVTVDGYQDGEEESYTLTSESLQVTIPLSSYYAHPVPDLVDCTICLALTSWCYYIKDPNVLNYVKGAAQSGLQTVTQSLAQNAVLKS